MNASTACEMCGAGQYSGSMATVCTDCVAGRADDDSDPSTACVVCPAYGYETLARATSLVLDYLAVS